MAVVCTGERQVPDGALAGCEEVPVEVEGERNPFSQNLRGGTKLVQKVGSVPGWPQTDPSTLSIHSVA